MSTTVVKGVTVKPWGDLLAVLDSRPSVVRQITKWCTDNVEPSDADKLFTAIGYSLPVDGWRAAVYMETDTVMVMVNDHYVPAIVLVLGTGRADVKAPYHYTLGGWYGYPECCDRTITAIGRGELVPDWVNPLDGSGYVPCAACAALGADELTRRTNDRRFNPAPFPQHHWESHSASANRITQLIHTNTLVREHPERAIHWERSL